MLKYMVATIIIIGGVVYANLETCKREYRVYQLNKELKDVYSYSHHYEKMQRHGVSVSREKWEKLHIRKADVIAELELLDKFENN